eukprot:3579742-Pleurochrysis_carterae.AAC.13
MVSFFRPPADVYSECVCQDAALIFRYKIPEPRNACSLASPNPSRASHEFRARYSTNSSAFQVLNRSCRALRECSAPHGKGCVSRLRCSPRFPRASLPAFSPCPFSRFPLSHNVLHQPSQTERAEHGKSEQIPLSRVAFTREACAIPSFGCDASIFDRAHLRTHTSNIKHIRSQTNSCELSVPLGFTGSRSFTQRTSSFLKRLPSSSNRARRRATSLCT